MRVVYVSPEVSPFSKTGGLADVAGALPKALAARGADVAVFSPYYLETDKRGFSCESAAVNLRIPVGEQTMEAQVLKSRIPGSNVPVYLIRHDPFFMREGLYQEKGLDYPDNSARFIFFSRAVMECIEALGIEPDVIHVNDWQSAMVAVYARTIYTHRPAIANAATLLTVHNMGYQGLFWHLDMPLTGLSWELYNWKQLEFFDRMNFLKGGIVFADRINTVSKTYAEEIKTPEFGCGLEGVLAERGQDLHGIANGIDTSVWNPKTDPHIAERYSARNMNGKAACKRALLKEAGIQGEGFPLFAMITRLDPQKGVDLVLDVLDEAVAMGMRLVILGTGDPKYAKLLEEAEEKHKGKVKAFLTFDVGLSHRIEAGADAFLMPSRYEPCGLNQLMSLSYGTVPVVRATGGLADTVHDFSEEDLGKGLSTGFSFREADSSKLLGCIARALRIYSNRDAWRRLMANGMAQDWSWERSAGEYLALYETMRKPSALLRLSD